MKNLVFLFTLLSMSFFSFFTAHAQDGTGDCQIIIKEKKNGTVWAGGPRTFRIKDMQKDDLTIYVNKKGGRAETIVNVYYTNNSGGQTRIGHIDFENGNYTDTRELHLSNLEGKDVQIVITNQSVANRFEYSLKAFSTVSWERHSRLINARGEKTIELTHCAQTVKIQRTQRNATANVIFYEKKFDESNFRQVHTAVINQTHVFLEYSFPSTSSYLGTERKVEIRNVSRIGNPLYLDIQVLY